MSGDYTCTVTRGSESKSSTMKVDVYYTTKIQSIMLTTDSKINLKVLISKYFDKFIFIYKDGTIDIINQRGKIDIFNTTKLQVECNAVANPLPVSIWKRNGVIISNIKLLHLNPSVNADSGIYICTSENGRSKDSKQVNLNIITKPIISTVQPFQKLKRGGRLNQNCPIGNMDSNTEVSWWQV